MEEFKKSKGSPIFNLVKNKEGKVIITVGEYVASKKQFDSFEQAERYIGTKPWEIIINLVEITMYYEKEQNSKKSTKKTKTTATNAENN